MAGEARERLSHDLAIGLSRLAQVAAAASADPNQAAEQKHAAFEDAMSLLHEAELREGAGFESGRRFAAPNIQKLLESLEEDMKTTEINHRKGTREGDHAR